MSGSSIQAMGSGSKEIRVVHIVLSLEPGGMENGIVNVARRLHKNGFDIYACCLERKGDFSARMPEPSKVALLNKPPGISPRTVLRLAKYFKITKPDIIHTHNFGPLIYTTLAGFFTRRYPVLHGEHGMLKGEDSGLFKITFRKFCYKNCALIHTVSDGLREYFIAQGFSAEKIIAIKNGVDTERFVPASKYAVRRSLGIATESIIIGIVGRMDTGKRHLELVEAFNGLAEQYPELYLLMVGSGGTNYQAVVEAVRKSPNSNRIIMAGYQSEPVPFYQAMDLLVIPSLKEGFPNVLLEAMACGVPALAHPTPGTRETIENNIDGFLRDLTSVSNLKNAIEESISDRARLGQIGINARQKVEKQFSLQLMAEKYAEVYRRIVGEVV